MNPAPVTIGKSIEALRKVVRNVARDWKATIQEMGVDAQKSATKRAQLQGWETISFSMTVPQWYTTGALINER